MKISIALSVLILAAAAGLRWYDAQRLAVVRGNHAKLVAETATFGITPDSTRPAEVIRATRRERERKNEEAKAAAAAYIAFRKEKEEARRSQAMEHTDRMLALDSTQAQIFLDALRDAGGLSDENRKDMIGYALWTLSEKHPQPVLALFTESFDLLKKDEFIRRNVVSSSLAKWSEQDPKAACEWVRKNEAKFPELLTDSTKIGIISGAARHDPKLAFELIAELGIQESSSALRQIGGSAKTSAERTALISALREHLTTLPDEKARDKAADDWMGTFSDGLAGEGFAAATQWIAGVNCTPTELDRMAISLGVAFKGEEPGQWMEWIDKKLPIDRSGVTTSVIVKLWTERDYQAAGKWLASTPASATKNTAIRSYAETVAKLDPTTATQWAMTLPPGPDRDATLKHIQDHLPGN